MAYKVKTIRNNNTQFTVSARDRREAKNLAVISFRAGAKEVKITKKR
jgi:hypothetical protein